MTSSERHLEPNQKRWDYGIARYKETDDVFLEPGLFSIVVLAHGRPTSTRKAILSTLDSVRMYDDELEWIFIENGGCEATYEFFQGLNLERKIIVRQKNYGINEGLNQGWALSRGEYIFIHENDWEAVRQANFLKAAKEIFEEQPNVGIIQLRDPLDPHENHGSGKPFFNPWSCRQAVLDRAKVKIWKEQTNSGHSYLIAEIPYGFNNNPVIIRKNVYRQCGAYLEAEVGCDPRHGESVYQERVAKLGCATAYIGMGIYWHMGRIQTQAV